MRHDVFHWARQRMLTLGIGVVAPAFLLSAPALATAQDDFALSARDYPMAIHEGTCATLATEPTYAFGFLSPRPLLNIEEGTYVERPLLDEDLDDDGVLDPDEDLDDDGLIDYGFDLDASDILDAGELLEAPFVWSFEGDLGDLEAVDEEDANAELEDLRDTSHALVVHGESLTDTNYLACGDIVGVGVNGEVVVPLHPVQNNGLSGVAELEEGDDGFLGVGDDDGEVEIHAWTSQVLPGQQGGSPATPAS